MNTSKNCISCASLSKNKARNKPGIPPKMPAWVLVATFGIVYVTLSFSNVHHEHYAIGLLTMSTDVVYTGCSVPHYLDADTHYNR